MSAGHSHSAAGQHRWRLRAAFVLVATFFAVELAAGLASGSLALIADAGHMAADVVTLAAALLATRIAARPASGQRTYGSYRAEIFASGLAVLIMLGVSTFIASEAISRIGEPSHPQTGTMFVVGALGLVINLICLALLRGGASHSLNVKGAYLEVLADTLGSVGVILAAALVAWTSAPWWDTVIGLAIAVFVAVRAIALGREVLAVLGQHAPAETVPAQVLAALAEVEGVTDVHDLHIWQLTSGMNVATAHLVADPGDSADALAAATTVLRERFGIEHATLQIETTTECACANW